ncbi:DUF2500 domain-containing protein [Ornithinimicrobium flavum]|uniref:DUF2500 domain-containing protein n=1 Tax=Ornithinimicrobium flavum TaxID=1288636 RepID=UPI00193106BA|nr:DUF2500 domain-containing protein [Ornithinimicrobium flavum]
MDPDVLFDPEVTPDPFAGPGDGLFSAVPVLMGIFFIIFVIVVVVKLVQAGQTYANNSALPERTVAARVVGKRTHTEGGAGDSAVQTAYFATFEVTGGDRIEVKIPQREYGQLAEGDQGQLTHQGTWYRGFERRRVIPTDGSWEAPGGPSLQPPSTT